MSWSKKEFSQVLHMLAHVAYRAEQRSRGEDDERRDLKKIRDHNMSYEDLVAIASKEL